MPPIGMRFTPSLAFGDARPSSCTKSETSDGREGEKQNEKVNKTLRVVVRAWRRQRARDSSYGFVAVLARHVGHHGPSRRLPLCSSRSCLPTSNPSPSRAQAYAPNATYDMQPAPRQMQRTARSMHRAPYGTQHDVARAGRAAPSRAACLRATRTTLCMRLCVLPRKGCAVDGGREWHVRA